MPFTFGFKGSFFELGKFFNRLDRFVAVKSRGLDVTGRLLLLNSITLTPDPDKGFPTLTANIERGLVPAPADRGPDGRRDPGGPDAAPRERPPPRRPALAPPPPRPQPSWSHPMSVINDTWRFLVQRKLWPVAILLIAAAAAVPMLLAQEPDAPAAAPAAAVKGDERPRWSRPSRSWPWPATPTAAAAGTCSARARTRSSRTPPRLRPRLPSRRDGAGPDRRRPPAAADRDAGRRPGRLARAARPPGFTHPVTAVTPEDVRALRADRALRGEQRHGRRRARTSSVSRRCRPATSPALIYLGVLKDKKTAVFMVDSGVVAQGDGTCKPSRTNCETIHLKEGETEFFDVASEDGADDPDDLRHPVPARRAQDPQDDARPRPSRPSAAWRASPSPAARSCAPGSPATGRCATATTSKSGRLQKLSKKAYKAVVAKAAKAARAHF